MATDIIKERYNHVLGYDYGLAPTEELLSETRINRDGAAWLSWGSRARDIGVLIKFNTDELEPDE